MDKRLPGMSIPLVPGAPPPPFCPRCIQSPSKAQKPWAPLKETVKTWYQERGYRALAQCSGCMSVLIEVEEVPD